MTKRASDAPVTPAAVIDAAEHPDTSVVAPEPMAAVRADVGRIADFFRSIHSAYLWSGIIFFLATAVTGVIIVASAAAADWYMHAFMYFVLLMFILFYVRAHLVKRKLARGFYAVVSLALIGFFAWVLVDLIAPRLVVIDGEAPGLDGAMVSAPEAIQRGRLGALIAPVVMLGLVGAWLLAHWLFVARFHHDDEG